jgi:hypothetical protein
METRRRQTWMQTLSLGMAIEVAAMLQREDVVRDVLLVEPMATGALQVASNRRFVPCV